MHPHVLKLYSRKESGAVLYTGLVFLLVLSLIVLSVLRSGTLEERMASNARNRQVALQAAEAEIRNAEVQLFTGSGYISKFNSYPPAGGSFSSGFYAAQGTTTSMNWTNADWVSTSKTLTTGTVLTGVSEAPRYIVEIITPPTRPNSTVPCSKGVAMVTARGMGKDSSTVFVQTMYRYQSDRPADGC